MELTKLTAAPTWSFAPLSYLPNPAARTDLTANSNNTDSIKAGSKVFEIPIHLSPKRSGMQMSQASTPELTKSPFARSEELKVNANNHGDVNELRGKMASVRVPNVMTVLSHVFAVEEKLLQDLKLVKIEVEELKKEVGNLKKTPSDVSDGSHVEGGQGIHSKDGDVKNGDGGHLLGETAPGADANTDQTTSEAQPPKVEHSWKPLAIRLLPALETLNLPLSHRLLPFTSPPLQTFSLQFLTSIFGGTEYSPGLFYPTVGTPTSLPMYKTILPKSKTFYAIDAAVDPFVPRKPGDHGAKLSVFFNELEDEGLYDDVPLFVCLPGCEGDGTALGKEKEYTYMGNYTQRRWSDKLDYDRVAEVVPKHVKEFWAAKLASHPDRPMWIENALMEAFWPKPKYERKLLKGNDEDKTTVTRMTVKSNGNEHDAFADMQAYLEDLRDWEKDSRMMAGLLKKENILEAFDRVREPIFDMHMKTQANETNRLTPNMNLGN